METETTRFVHFLITRVHETSRRTFLRNATVAVGGVALASQASVGTAAAQDGDIPEYADWVGDELLAEVSTTQTAESVVALGMPTAIDVLEFLQGGDNSLTDEIEGELPPSSITFTYISITAAFSWATLDQLGIALEVIGDEGFTGEDSDSEMFDFDAEPPADRQLAFGGVSVYLGEFDTDALQTAVDEQDGVEETETDGIYTGENNFNSSRYFAWDEDSVIIADSVETVERVQDVGSGDSARRYEEDDQFAELLRAGGNQEVVEISQSEPDESQFDQLSINGVDTRPYEEGPSVFS